MNLHTNYYPYLNGSLTENYHMQCYVQKMPNFFLKRATVLIFWKLDIRPQKRQVNHKNYDFSG